MTTGAPSAALRLDLNPWKQGLNKASALVKSTLDGPKALSSLDKAGTSLGGKLGKIFGGLGGSLSGALGGVLGPLAAIGTVAGGLILVKNVLIDSVTAARNYNDSLVELRSALQFAELAQSNFTGVINPAEIANQERSVIQLGNTIRTALGFSAADVNRSYATFLTRQFKGPQAEQLTILAANFAQKTGKPLQDIVKKIADAANGEVGALKELGLEIDATGNKALDAENALKVLLAAGSGLGNDLVNPSQEFSAALQNISLLIGQEILPLIDPLIQGTADFLNGLTQTEEGRAAIEGIGTAVGFVIDSLFTVSSIIGKVIDLAVANFNQLESTVRLIANKLLEIIIQTLRDIPFFDDVLAAAGFDPETLQKSFADSAKTAFSDFEKASKESNYALVNLFKGENTSAAGNFIERTTEAGKGLRESARQDLIDRQGSANAADLVGGAARQDTEAKEKAQQEQAAQKAQQKADQSAQKQAGRFSGSANVEPGSKVSVTVVSNRRDPFRRAGRRFRA
jgi:hypothetical protein